MTEKEKRAQITQAHIDGYNRGYAKAKADLETENNKLLDVINNQDVKIADLEKENAELRMKRKAERQIFQGIVEKKNEQLSKATEIIKKFSEFVNNEIEYDPEYPQEHTDLWNELCEQVEQFLKEIEK